MLEKLIAYHCGPALAGIKPANIVACNKKQMPDINMQIKKLNNQLNCRGIYLEILNESDTRVLIVVYRKNVLEKYLLAEEMKKFLTVFGYPNSENVRDYIDFLKGRMTEEEFPHEIGAFLGYPLHDIRGFINHRSEGCLLNGEWKVYKDVEKAKKLFMRYKACRRALVKRVAGGSSLEEIFCVA